MTVTPRSLAPGIYCPSVAFFTNDDKQDLDITAYTKHMRFLARSGIHGVVVQGSTGEAVTMSLEERQALIRAAKEAFRLEGNQGAIIAGTVGAQSTREVLKLCQNAAEAGADYALVLPPSYWPQWMTEEVLDSFYLEVANDSLIPLVIYSYPGVCAGINMHTDTILKLAEHPNIVGIKHTDNDIGKMSREAAAHLGSSFTILGGATDYLLGCLSVGGHGAISGLASLAPRVCVRAFDLVNEGRLDEALELQKEMSKAEWGISKGGLLGNKYSVVFANSYPEYSALARRPLPPCPTHVKDHVKETCTTLVAMERSLEEGGYVGSGMKPKLNGVSKKKGL